MIDTSYKRFFTTLGNENRLKIIHFLAENGHKNVSEIATGTRLEQSAVSHNLKRLLSCEFIHLQPNGKERIYSINEKTIKPLLVLMDKHVRKFCKRACEKCEYPEQHLPNLPRTQMPRSSERGFMEKREAKFSNAPTVRSWVRGLPISNV